MDQHNGANKQNAAKKAPDVKLVIYDFDQTITAIHLYHELNDHGMDQEVALSKMSNKRLLQIFGGKGRLEALNRHFSALKEHKIEIAILSFGFVGVIHACRRRCAVTDRGY